MCSSLKFSGSREVDICGYVRWVREEDDEETFTLNSDESSRRLSRSHSELSFFHHRTMLMGQILAIHTRTSEARQREKQWSLPHYMRMTEIMREAEKSLISCSNKQFAGVVWWRQWKSEESGRRQIEKTWEQQKSVIMQNTEESWEISDFHFAAILIVYWI